MRCRWSRWLCNGILFRPDAALPLRAGPPQWPQSTWEGWFDRPGWHRLQPRGTVGDLGLAHDGEQSSLTFLLAVQDIIGHVSPGFFQVFYGRTLSRVKLRNSTTASGQEQRWHVATARLAYSICKLAGGRAERINDLAKHIGWLRLHETSPWPSQVHPVRFGLAAITVADSLSLLVSLCH